MQHVLREEREKREAAEKRVKALEQQLQQQPRIPATATQFHRGDGTHLFSACTPAALRSNASVDRVDRRIGRWKKMARGSCDKKVPLAAFKEDRSLSVAPDVRSAGYHLRLLR